MFDHYGHVAEEVLAAVQEPIADLIDVVARIGGKGVPAGDLFAKWTKAERFIVDSVGEELQKKLKPEFERATVTFHALLTNNLLYGDAQTLAQTARSQEIPGYVDRRFGGEVHRAARRHPGAHGECRQLLEAADNGI